MSKQVKMITKWVLLSTVTIVANFAFLFFSHWLFNCVPSGHWCVEPTFMTLLGLHIILFAAAFGSIMVAAQLSMEHLNQSWRE